jgi:hypothetical protein
MPRSVTTTHCVAHSEESLSLSSSPVLALGAERASTT